MTAALLFLRALPWRIIGPAIGALLMVLAIYNTGKRHELAKLLPQIEAARANVATLKAALATQNAAIAAQAKAGEAVAVASRVAIRTGAERRGAVDAAAARVEVVQPSGAVTVPDDVRKLWGEM